MIPSLNLGKIMVFCVSSCGAIVCVVVYGEQRLWGRIVGFVACVDVCDMKLCML